MLALLQQAIWLASAVCVQFVSIKHSGHLGPIVAAARELLQRGHEVRLSTHEEGRKGVSAERMCRGIDGSCRYQFISAGSIPMSEERQALSNQLTFSPDTPPWIAIPEVSWLFTTLQASMLANLLPRLQQLTRPDILVSDSVTLAGADIAELLAVPLVLISSQLPVTLQGSSRCYAALDAAILLDLHDGYEAKLKEQDEAPGGSL